MSTNAERSHTPELEGVSCVNCGAEGAPGTVGSCKRCAFPLAVRYDRSLGLEGEDRHRVGVWRYARRLPSLAERNRVTLGEGGTPLLEVPKLARWLGLKNAFVKNEALNPTGSFKDRATALGMSLAVEVGARRAAVASTGNAALSLAAYGLRAGVSTVAFVSDSIPIGRASALLNRGMDVVRVKGSVSDTFLFLRQVADDNDWLNLTSTFINPYTVEANKTVAYEISDILADPPDVILVPVSVGPLLVGLYRGFRELYETQQVGRIPRLVAVQAEGCSPIVSAFEHGLSEVVACRMPKSTIASGIADPLVNYEQDGTYTLRTLADSGGFAIACSDNEILDATAALAMCEGIQAEPTGAAAVAGAKKAVEQGLIAPDERTLVIVTAGRREIMEVKAEDLHRLTPIDACPEALEGILRMGGT